MPCELGLSNYALLFILNTYTVMSSSFIGGGGGEEGGGVMSNVTM